MLEQGSSPFCADVDIAESEGKYVAVVENVVLKIVMVGFLRSMRLHTKSQAQKRRHGDRDA